MLTSSVVSAIVPRTMWSMNIDQTRRDRLWSALAELRGYCSSWTSPACSHPRQVYSARLPDRDHASAWYDPVAKHHVGADEPYAGSVASKVAERDAWARQHNWSLARPEWAGMYYPEGCELYLYADASKGYSLDGLLLALYKAPSPIVPANCDRVVIEGHTRLLWLRERGLRPRRSSRETSNERLPRHAVPIPLSSTGCRSAASGAGGRRRRCLWTRMPG